MASFSGNFGRKLFATMAFLNAKCLVKYIPSDISIKVLINKLLFLAVAGDVSINLMKTTLSVISVIFGESVSLKQLYYPGHVVYYTHLSVTSLFISDLSFPLFLLE